MEILDRYHAERSLFGTVIVKNLDITVPGRLLQLPLFKAFDRKFRMLVTLYCERHAFFPEHVIVQEGEVGDKIWILNLGPASLLKGKFAVKLLQPGSHYGCENMLGIVKCYVCAMKSVTVCHALSLNRLSYLTTLEQYPANSAHKELLKEQKAKSQKLREEVERIARQKMILTRYQGVRNQSRKSIFFLSEDDLVRRMVLAWREFTQTIREKRALQKKRQEEIDEDIEDWCRNQAAAHKKASRKKRMSDLVKSNLSERGPLRYLEDDDDELADVPKALPLLPKQRTELASALKAWPSPRPSPHYNLKMWAMMGEELSESGRHSALLPMLSGSPRGNFVKSSERTPRREFRVVPDAD